MNTKASINQTAPKRALALLLALVLALGLLTVAAPRARADSELPVLTSVSFTDVNIYYTDYSEWWNPVTTFACKVTGTPEIETYATPEEVDDCTYLGIVRISVNTPRAVENGVITDTVAEYPNGSLDIAADQYEVTVTGGTLYGAEGWGFSVEKVDGENKWMSANYDGICLAADDNAEYWYHVEITAVEDGPTIPDPPSPNNAPKIKNGVENPTTAHVLPGSAWTLDLSTIFRDADGDALTYTVKIGDAQPVAADENYSYTPTGRQISFEFTASDGTDTSVPYQVTLFRNTRPNRKSGLSESTYKTAIVGETWTIDLSEIYEDADGDDLTYSVRVGYSCTSEPTSAVYSYTPTEAGQISFYFSASDGLQSGGTYNVNLTVSNPNQAPRLKEGVPATAAATVAVGQAWAVDLSTVFEDPDGSSLSYKVKVNGADAVSASRNYSYTPETAGVTTLVFTAVDDQNEESSDTYTVTVTANASLHVITASTNDYYQWNNYTCNAMGIFTVKVGGNDVVAAAEGDIVTVTATPQSILEGYAGAGSYQAAFAGWTATGIELTQQQAQSAELTFTMPDQAVTLTAAFVKTGSSVTLTANDFNAGEASFNIGEYGNNSANQTTDPNTNQHVRDSVTDIIPGGKTVYAYFVIDNTAYTLDRWVVVNTSTNQPVDVTLDNPQGDPNYEYYRCSFVVDGTSSYTITAIIEAKDYGEVNVTVNNSAMGTATAQVGTATAATSLMAVTEGETVTLTATPATGYVFTGWTATYGTTAVEITNANQASASFVMPATNRAAVNVTANFARDPQYASHDCELIDLYLYDGAEEVDYSIEQDGNDLLVTLDEGVNAYYLKDWTLVLELSDYAAATVNGVAWPAAGKVIGSAITANTPATIMVTAEDGTTTTTYTLTVAGEVTAVPVEITAQPQDATVKVGKKASFRVSATGGSGDYSYQWYYRADENAQWAPSTAASGKTAKYVVTVKARHDGYQYYCVVTDAQGNTASSAVATLTVAPALSIVTQPQDVEAPEGETVTVTVVARGEGLSYQWFVKKPTAAKFSKSSITTDTYSVALTAARSGNQIYCVITDAAGNTVRTNTVTMTIDWPLTVADLEDFTGPEGSEVVFTVQPVGEGPFTYQWYVKKPTATKFSKSSITSDTYTVTLTEARNGNKVYCVITDAVGNTVRTNTVTMTIGG